MLFSAVHACPKCLLRFERRARCPECGGDEVVSLAGADRARFRRLVRAAHPESSAVVDALLMRVGEWVPTKPWLPLAVGIAMMVPLILSLASGQDASRGQVCFLGVAGALVASLAFVPKLAARAGERSARTSARTTLRVFAPVMDAETKRRSLTGVVRLATSECTSPLGETPCVAFGLVGMVNGSAIDDAEGGDFDVELESGERVFVSLEHAVLRVERPLDPQDASSTPALDEVLDARGVSSSRNQCALGEIVLCDGDEVTVEGVLSGSAAVAVAYRDGGNPRVLAGDERSPIVIFPTKRRRI